ncbi:hypothetical protein BDF14DRAFT_1827318 [Spinellus fusiger]|nr:hypothetical protein BDF14DRAFT_1827318 [Spinellus fusiger]
MQILPLKRKRTSLVNYPTVQISKSVRFVDLPVIIYTYSSSDYDRSSSKTPVLYKVNPMLSLAISSPTYSNHSLCQAQNSSLSNSFSHKHSSLSSLPSHPKVKKHKPNLSVDTSACTGPLFFTRLSTYPARHSVYTSSDESEEGDDDEDTSDYLVPMSAIV